MSDEKKRKCTKCNQTWTVTQAISTTSDFCSDGTVDHKFITLCGELSVGAGKKLSCDVHEGHGTRHSGVDEKGIRWSWDSPVQQPEMHPQHVMRVPASVSHREYREAAERSAAPDRIERHMDHTFGKEEKKPFQHQRPTVGRVVHYTNLGDRDGRFPPEIQAALITRVRERDGSLELLTPDMPQESRYAVSLHIFYEMGDFKMKDVSFTTEPAGTEYARGKWTWPAKV